MTQGTKKQCESFYLKKFLSCLGILSPCLREGDEPPDFILTLDNNQIAIEITDYYSTSNVGQQHPRQAVEQTWQKLRNTICIERKCVPELNDVYVVLHFKELCVPPKNKHVHFAKELITFVKGHYPVLNNEGSSFSSFEPDCPTMTSYLNKVQINRVNCYVAWDWNHDVSCVGISESELEKTIATKTKTTPKSSDYAEYWLLVVSGTALSQAMGMPHPENLDDYRISQDLANGPFDKVYIFQYMYDRILLWQRPNGWQEVCRANL
jgi:hypothetical protein